MSLFDEFLSLYSAGFRFSNNIFSASAIQTSLQQGKVNLKRDGDNFFLVQNYFITYFINEIRRFDMQGKYIKLIHKTPICKLENRFLSVNKFEFFDSYIGMSLKNNTFAYQICNEIKQAKISQADEIYEFFTRYFDKDYLFISKNELEIRIKNAQVFIIYNGSKIIGGLIYSLNLGLAHLDFIAVDESFRQNGVATRLMNCFLGLKVGGFRLFVRQINAGAISFYQKFGFEFNHIKILFFRREYEI